MTRLGLMFGVSVGPNIFFKKAAVADLYQMTWAMTHRPCHLVSRAGLVGRPRAKKDSNTKGHSQ